MDLNRGMIANYHVTMNDEKSKRLYDVKLIERFLRELTLEIGMTPLGSPVVHVIPIDHSRVKHELNDDGGITAMQVITTSHIAIHTWPLQGRARVSLDSCVPFAPITTEQWIKNFFGADNIETDWSQWHQWG